MALDGDHCGCPELGSQCPVCDDLDGASNDTSDNPARVEASFGHKPDKTEEIELLRLVHHAARGVMRYNGVDSERCREYYDQLSGVVQEVNELNDRGDDDEDEVEDTDTGWGLDEEALTLNPENADPRVGVTYEHNEKGTRYVIVGISNRSCTRPGWGMQVCYVDMHGNLLSRPLRDFFNRCTQVEEETPPTE